MKLKRLVISNCSRIEDLDIEVRDNLVLIGPNGSGKTTVLLCLDMLLSMDASRLHEVLSEDFVRDAARPFTVTGVLGCLTDDEIDSFHDEVDAQGDNDLLVRLEVALNDGGIDIVRYFPNGGSNVPPSQDQRAAFGWMLLRAQEYLSAKAQGRQANILAIDEPEAHLHPSSQRNLAKQLKRDSSQKVLVTHSPTIAGSFEPDEIVVIRADGIAAQPERGFLSGEAGVVARWWVGRQLEPLTAGTVVAVEGPSDRIIVNKVATALGFDLDQHDVVVVETEGCGNMKVVESIFGGGGFGIPLFELVDEDNREDIARRVGANPADAADLAKRHVFVSDKDLEDEYVHAIGAAKLWAKIKAAGVFSKSAMRLCRVGADGNPTEEDLAQFIREKSSRKIPSALVAVDLIDEANAPAVDSVAQLLKAASS